MAVNICITMREFFYRWWDFMVMHRFYQTEHLRRKGKLKHSARVNEQLVMRLNGALRILWLSFGPFKCRRRLKQDSCQQLWTFSTPFISFHGDWDIIALPSNISTTTSLWIPFSVLLFLHLRGRRFIFFATELKNQKVFFGNKTITRFNTQILINYKFSRGE